MRAIVFNPKCLFIVGNIIIVFLIGESKLLSSKSSPTTTDVYEDFVSWSGSFEKGCCSSMPKKVKVMKFERSRNRELKMDYKDEDDEVGLPAEELQKRAEDLIARVNKQIRMEAALYFL
ncbi:hypothetical protein Sjap_016550 [Stephania japonica]|uniref:DUF4408 domain-containing protein n=1 Tax=Stephania japonica TaxID=461633 RepID=A0AAP0IMF0_9MAGN